MNPTIEPLPDFGADLFGTGSINVYGTAHRGKNIAAVCPQDAQPGINIVPLQQNLFPMLPGHCENMIRKPHVRFIQQQ